MSQSAKKALGMIIAMRLAISRNRVIAGGEIFEPVASLPGETFSLNIPGDINCARGKRRRETSDP